MTANEDSESTATESLVLRDLADPSPVAQAGLRDTGIIIAGMTVTVPLAVTVIQDIDPSHVYRLTGTESRPGRGRPSLAAAQSRCQ